MSETFTGALKVAVTGDLGLAADLGNTNYVLNYAVSKAIANGTGADQANQIFTDTRTLSASATESLDLSGVLTNAFGETILFTSIKGIVIAPAAANTNDVIVGGAASNAFINWVSDATDKVVVKPGGVFALYAPSAAGYAITAGTGDLLKVANSSSGTSVTYDILLIGTI